MVEEKKEAFDPEQYFKKLRESKSQSSKSGLNIELSSIFKTLGIMTLISIVLISSIYFIKVLLGVPREKIVNDMFIISLWLIGLPIVYNLIGMSTGVNIHNTNATISAWTNKSFDSRRSMEDLKSFVSFGKVMTFTIYMGILQLIIFTKIFV